MTFHFSPLAFLVRSCTSPLVAQHPGVKKAQYTSCHQGLHGLAGDKRISTKGIMSEVTAEDRGTGETWRADPPGQGLRTWFCHLLTVWPWHKGQLLEPLSFGPHVWKGKIMWYLPRRFQWALNVRPCLVFCKTHDTCPQSLGCPGVMKKSLAPRKGITW